MNAIAMLGIDLAKQTFSLHGVDGEGRAVLRRAVKRHQLAELCILRRLSPRVAISSALR
jgi:hypothetical protein